MNHAPTDPAEQIRRLSSDLNDVSRREAWFRLKVAQDFLLLDAQLKAHREKLEALRQELDVRNAYIHELHLKDGVHADELLAAEQKLVEADRLLHFTKNAHVDELHAARVDRKRAEQALHADLEIFARQLRTVTQERDALQHDLARLKKTWGWGLSSPLRRLQRSYAPLPAPPAPTDPDLPGAAFTYYLHTSPFRLFRSTAFTLRGWAFPTDGRKLTAIRVRLGAQEFVGRHGLDEPEVIAQHGPQANNPRPGFEVDCTFAPGQQTLRLEAQLENREWFSVLSAPVWCQPAETS
jgi:hypothetical protein